VLLRVLVTGSAGFVGKNLVQHLKANQVDVKGLDFREGQDITYYLGSGEDLKTVLEPFETIIHLASESHVDRSITGPEIFIDSNVKGTLELFEAARQSKNIRQVILFSTDEVGGSLKQGSFREIGDPLHCGSVYSATKGAQELLAQAYLNTFNLPIITTRCVNIFGPYQAKEKFIPTIIDNALKDQSIPIYGSGMQKRQWVHVSHVCRFLNEICVSNMVPPGMVLHITGTKEIPNIFLAHTILNLLNKPASLISHVQDRLGHDERYSLDRTEDTDRFMLSLRYNEEDFLPDLKETILHYKKIFGG
jgi:dTDP-glucose 4,6-dehydratase